MMLTLFSDGHDSVSDTWEFALFFAVLETIIFVVVVGG
jgi:hypothetical protein